MSKIAQTLLKPIQLGDLTLKNKLIMAPMSRFRANPETLVPTDLMAEYYSQRSQFGLIITESSPISELSTNAPATGALFNEKQMLGWKNVVQKVHQKEGKIFIQLFHCGRAVVKDYINGNTPLAPSPIAVQQIHRFTNQPHPEPKEMTQNDILNVIQEFKKSAELAKEAGFDGIEIHAGNGYLIDQFLRDRTNKRTDKYGGSFENRCRFMLEVLDAVIPVFGAGRVGVRFSPTGRFGDMFESKPIELMQTAFKLLEPYNLAFVEVKKHDFTDIQPVSEGSKVDNNGNPLPGEQIHDNQYFSILKNMYKGTLIANCGFQPDTAAEAIENKQADLVAFGTLALQNPDLPQRIQNEWEINRAFDFSTFYMGGAKGYTDLPFYQEQQQL